MSDDRIRVWPWIVALLIGLPVIYMLSWGPAMKLLFCVPLPDSIGTAILAIYYPVHQFAEQSETATTFLQWYLPLWGDFSGGSANPAVFGQ
jgi:hypothetical protein